MKISFWFVLVLAVISVSSVSGIFSLLAIALHESSHLIALYLSGGTVSEIKLTIKDINISADKYGLSKIGAVFVSLSGPVSNLLMFYLLNLLGYNDFAITNLVIGVFNLLPITSLDGNQALGIITDNRAPLLLKLVSIIFSSLILLFGILLLFSTKYNFSLLIVGLYLVYLSSVSDT